MSTLPHYSASPQELEVASQTKLVKAMRISTALDATVTVAQRIATAILKEVYYGAYRRHRKQAMTGMLKATSARGHTRALTCRTTAKVKTKRGRCTIPNTGTGVEADDSAQLFAVRTQTVDPNVVARWQHMLSEPKGHDPALDAALDVVPNMAHVEDEEDVFVHGGGLDG